MAAHPTIRVYSYKPSPSVLKSEIAGKFGGVKVEYIDGFEMGKTNKTEEFLKLNPNGQVPTAITNDGPIFESNAIAYYVARVGCDSKGLLGETPYQQANVDEWVNFSRSRFEGIYPLFSFAMGWGTYDQAKFDEALKKVTDAFTVIERHLTHSGSTFLVGNRVTLADIVVYASLWVALNVSITEAVFHPFPKTRAYFGHVLANEHVKSSGPPEIKATFTAPAPAQK